MSYLLSNRNRPKKLPINRCKFYTLEAILSDQGTNLSSELWELLDVHKLRTKISFTDKFFPANRTHLGLQNGHAFFQKKAIENV